MSDTTDTALAKTIIQSWDTLIADMNNSSELLAKVKADEVSPDLINKLQTIKSIAMRACNFITSNNDIIDAVLDSLKKRLSTS